MRSIVVSPAAAAQATSQLVVAEGANFASRTGGTRELIGLSIEVTDDPSVLNTGRSSSERSTIFVKQLQLLTGESCDDLLARWDPPSPNLVHGTTYDGAYGPQLAPRLAGLAEGARGRQAVLSLVDYDGITPSSNCFHFMERPPTLYLHTYNRSVDVWRCLDTDLSLYRFLLEVVRSENEVPRSCYRHVVGSAHIHLNDLTNMDSFAIAPPSSAPALEGTIAFHRSRAELAVKALRERKPLSGSRDFFSVWVERCLTDN